MSYIFEVKVVPSSGKNGFVLDKAGCLKVYLKNPAEKGLANAELIKLLAKALGLTQQDVEITSGAISKKKKIKIPLSLTFEQLIARLGIERQGSIF